MKSAAAKLLLLFVDRRPSEQKHYSISFPPTSPDGSVEASGLVGGKANAGE
jgi:hypothetical protein